MARARRSLIVDLTGSGTGEVSYQINDEPTVTGSSCTVEGLEDDRSAVLQLTFGFTDAVHGFVAVAVSLSDFSAQTNVYDDIDHLDILATMGGGQNWSSGVGSSVLLAVEASPTGSGCRYRGTFSASNLAMLGGRGNALAIKFASYDVTLEPTGGAP